MRLIPIFVVTWVLGRLLFDFGYRMGPLYRGPGFAMTILPSMTSLTLLSYYQFYEGPWVLSLISAYFAVRRIYVFLAFNGTSPLKLIFKS